eukprot:TRINITY_DN8095_c0_g3_i1.p1 TRINITY_DN8095_c0_g3~~TRINITY_DN8095_c0_g3_i1.p1  ORF type:complete len:253 (+),score=58.74 TRINITY_DN8095_c0_g3_i1:112-870(+)
MGAERSRSRSPVSVSRRRSRSRSGGRRSRERRGRSGGAEEVHKTRFAGRSGDAKAEGDAPVPERDGRLERGPIRNRRGVTQVDVDESRVDHTLRGLKNLDNAPAHMKPQGYDSWRQGTKKGYEKWFETPEQAIQRMLAEQKAAELAKELASEGRGGDSRDDHHRDKKDKKDHKKDKKDKKRKRSRSGSPTAPPGVVDPFAAAVDPFAAAPGGGAPPATDEEAAAAAGITPSGKVLKFSEMLRATKPSAATAA